MPLFRRDDRRPGPSAPVVTGVVRASVREIAPAPPGPTRIGAGLVVEGRVVGAGAVEVAGRVVGGVAVDGTLTVRRGGLVEGDAGGREVRVEGRVAGRVVASQRATVAAEGSVEGDVEAPRVVIAEGAYLRGSVRMGGERGQRAATAGESS
jgi:cytoskeletal protein CcmA (bactofilin family)